MCLILMMCLIFFFKQKTADDMRISYWSSDVCSSDLCASTALVAQLLAVHSHAIAYYDPRLQEEIWGADPDALVGSSVAPVGKVTPVEGGYRLSGRYSWSSG